MAEARSNTQLPSGFARSVVDEELEAFRNGMELGRQYADVAVRRVAAWAEEHPGQLLIAGLAAGFVLGKLLLRPKRLALEDLDDL
ncbi:MAG: hypothetical protein ACXWLM_01280 [Myxococcales bacterium]